MTKYTKTFADAMKEVREPKVVKEDYEVSMALGQLKTIQERVGKIMDFLSGKSDDYNMEAWLQSKICLLYTSPSPRDGLLSRMPSSA